MTTSPVVERSVSGRCWRWRDHDADAALAISQRGGLPEIVGRVLAGRGVVPGAVEGFMAPRLRDALPDPGHLLGMDVAVARLADAVVGDQPIGLIGDYDVDGATSSALLARHLTALGARPVIDIPDRLREGYGPNADALARLAAAGCRLVVTLDSGTTAFDPLAGAVESGQEVIVVDHHVAEARLPDALAVVNPNRCDQVSPATDLAAVGVTFLVTIALNRELRRRGHFARRKEPDLRAWLDLVALGTVCDLVPLVGLNRALVAQGLKVAARGGNPGLTALAAAARLRPPMSADQMAFFLGPRINAGGRTGRSELGARLLTSDAPGEVAEIAAQLDQLNQERRQQERRVLDEVETRLAPAIAAEAPLLITAGEGWSAGVVGLAASRLVERHHRPAIVIGLENGVGKGSGRSIAGFDLGQAVIAARQEGLLIHGGGHPMAAGLTVAADRVEALGDFLMGRLDGGATRRVPEPPELTLDGALEVSALSPALAERLAELGPFGRGNPEPRFMLPQVHGHRVRQIGDAHLDCWLQDAAGGRVRAVAFRALDRPLGQALRQAAGAPLRLAGVLKLDHWQGRARTTFHIEDAASPG